MQNNVGMGPAECPQKPNKFRYSVIHSKLFIDTKCNIQKSFKNMVALVVF